MSVPDAAAFQAMKGMGMDPWYAYGMVALYQGVRRGSADAVTGTVELVTGHSPAHARRVPRGEPSGVRLLRRGHAAAPPRKDVRAGARRGLVVPEAEGRGLGHHRERTVALAGQGDHGGGDGRAGRQGFGGLSWVEAVSPVTESQGPDGPVVRQRGRRVELGAVQGLAVARVTATYSVRFLVEDGHDAAVRGPEDVDARREASRCPPGRAGRAERFRHRRRRQEPQPACRERPERTTCRREISFAASRLRDFW